MALHLHNRLFLRTNCASGLGNLVTEKRTMLTSLALAVGHMAATEAEQPGSQAPKTVQRTSESNLDNFRDGAGLTWVAGSMTTWLAMAALPNLSPLCPLCLEEDEGPEGPRS